VPGTGRRPEAANVYPQDSTRAEVDAWLKGLEGTARDAASGFFTTIRRDPSGALTAVPYSREYQTELMECARLLREAAALTTQPTLKSYLEKRAAAFLANDYYESDLAWMALDATIVPYGTPAERENVARSRAMLTRMAAEGVADRASFLGKLEAGAVLSGKGDLVLEVMSDRFALSSIEPEKLEPRFRNLFAAEREEEILRRVEERRRLQDELARLLRQRDAAVAEQMKALAGRGEVFELSAFQVLEKQAGDKGFRFGER
jgi:hypothetical protein